MAHSKVTHLRGLQHCCHPADTPGPHSHVWIDPKHGTICVPLTLQTSMSTANMHNKPNPCSAHLDFECLHVTAEGAPVRE
jgi:hypothetical protein